MPSACSCTEPPTTWSTSSVCSYRNPGARRRSKLCAPGSSKSEPAYARPPAASASTSPAAGRFRTCSAPSPSPSTAVDLIPGLRTQLSTDCPSGAAPQTLPARHPYAPGPHTLALLTPLIVQSLPTNYLPNQNLSPHELSRLDMVIKFTPQGKTLAEWCVLDEEPWSRFSRTVDYRKVESTKPHQAHPNFVFELDGKIWATRLRQRDAISLNGSGKRIKIAIQSPHDGVLCGDRIWFTTVDANIVIASRHTLKVDEIIDLKQIGDENT